MPELMLQRFTGEKAAEGVGWLRELAEGGDIRSMISLREVLSKGMSGVEKNPWESCKWSKKIAEAGAPIGYFFLASCYVEGEGVPLNRTEAMRLMKLGAERDEIIAQIGLAKLYFQASQMPINEETKVVTRDLAYFWSCTAASNPGSSIFLNGIGPSEAEPARRTARDLRDQIERSMSPDEVRNQQELAAKWVSEHRTYQK